MTYDLWKPYIGTYDYYGLDNDLVEIIFLFCYPLMNNLITNVNYYSYRLNVVPTRSSAHLAPQQPLPPEQLHGRHHMPAVSLRDHHSPLPE